VHFIVGRYDIWKAQNGKHGGKSDSSQRLMSSFTSLQSFYHSSHHRQKELSDAVISHLVIAGNLPLNLVEQPYFKEFMKVVDQKYNPPTRYNVNRAVNKKFQLKRALLHSKLQEAQYVTLTLDMWSDRRMRSFMGITVHFLSTDMKLQSFLLDFKHFSERHTGENMADHCAKVIENFNLGKKVYFVVTDNAANMLSAFKDMSEILGDAVEDDNDDDEDDELDERETGETRTGLDDEIVNSMLDEENSAEETAEALREMGELGDRRSDQVLDYIGGIAKKRLPCCIHTIQLVVLDGLKAAKFMSNVQSKSCKLANLLHCSGNFEQKFFAVFKTTIPKSNSTRWNSTYLQLVAISKLDASKLQRVLNETKNDPCVFTKRECEILKEVIEVLEPAYNATLIMEEDTAVVSLVAPTVAALYKKWSQMQRSVKFADTLIAALLKSLEKRFVGLLINIGILPPQKTHNGDVIDTATLNFGDPLFLVAAALDPEFRLNWLNVEHDDTIKVAITCKAKLHTLIFL